MPHPDRVVFLLSPTFITVQFQISSQMGFRATKLNERQSSKKAWRGKLELTPKCVYLDAMGDG